MDGTLGEIRGFGGNFPPRQWAYCDGQLLSIAQNQALFSILGTTYGGDGRTTFGLPDLRGRIPTHAGTGPGLTPIRLGQRSGIEYAYLSTSQLPPHNHTAAATVTLQVNNGDGDIRTPNGNYLSGDVANSMYSSAPTAGAALEGASAVVTTGLTGSQSAIPIRNPFLGIHMIICIQGLFPSRN